MKRTTLLLLSLFFFMLMISGCAEKSENDRVVIGNLAPVEGDLVYDISTIEGATECADLIVMGKINKLIETTVSDETDLPQFLYEVEILKIYYDRHSVLSVKDTVKFSSRSGYMPAIEYAEHMSKSKRGQKFNIAQDDYSSNEYFEFASFGSLAFDIEKTYIMFLDNDSPATSPVYREATYTQMYEISNSNLKQGTTKNISDFSLPELETAIYSAVSNRSGELDDGLTAYLEKQNNQDK